MVDGITRIADSIGAELKRRLPGQRKTQRGKLALLVATMLDVETPSGSTGRVLGEMME